MEKNRRSGIYLVIDPALGEERIIQQVKKITVDGLIAVQIWDSPSLPPIQATLIPRVLQVFKGKIPVLINNRWELLKEFDLDGVHFDTLSSDIKKIQEEIPREFIKGLTLTNNLKMIEKANQLKFDYLSFCAMFPSVTSVSCELVKRETVIECRKLTSIPIFLSGGITPQGIPELEGLPFDGVAIVSGIMNAENPNQAIQSYQQILKK